MPLLLGESDDKRDAFPLPWWCFVKFLSNQLIAHTHT